MQEFTMNINISLSFAWTLSDPHPCTVFCLFLFFFLWHSSSISCFIFLCYAHYAYDFFLWHLWNILKDYNSLFRNNALMEQTLEFHTEAFTWFYEKKIVLKSTKKWKDITDFKTLQSLRLNPGIILGSTFGHLRTDRSGTWA